MTENEPIQQGTTVELDHDHDGHDKPCTECAAGYRRLMVLTAATTFAAAIALIVLAATAWLAWEAKCG